MNILYNIFVVTGFLFWLMMLIILFVILYCWLADMIFYYRGKDNSTYVKDGDLLTIETANGTIIRRIARYEPTNYQPVDLSIHGSMANPSAEVIANGFHGGRYK